MDKDKALAKIKKCLALAKSANAHESATAMRQAQALMEQYGIEHSDVLASEAAEAGAKSGATKQPSNWEATLAGVVGRAFGCDLVFSGVPGIAAQWLFIGIGPKAEIAAYAFTVLLRQCKAARTEHIKTHLKRCKPAGKTRRADEFCQGWVFAVASTVRAFARSEEDTTAIDAYKAKRFKNLDKLDARDRSGGRDYGDSMRGHRA
ncbi:DUF2786 domain-containing protein, partial [Methylogaea oryzae]